jgi:hypothetical protein
MNNFAVATALATSPTSAFAELRERPRFWFPLLVVAISTAAMIGWYYSVVDIDWLKEQIFGNNPDMQKMPAEARAAAMGFMGRKTMLISGVFGAAMGIPFFFLVSALYFLLAAKITKMSPGLKHWFSLVCWCSLPILINVVAGAVFLLLRDNNQITPGVLQPLSLNELVFHRPMGAKDQAFFDSLNIPGILSWVLMIIGVHAWSQRSWVFSSVVALLPSVLIYGIWAIFVFR